MSQPVDNEGRMADVAAQDDEPEVAPGHAGDGAAANDSDQDAEATVNAPAGGSPTDPEQVEKARDQ